VQIEDPARVIYWRRDLPPIEANAAGEHTIEADSVRVAGTLEHRDELWDRCRTDLTARLSYRLEQEVRRLGGQYAHVLNERIATKHDPVTSEAWLYGCFTYMLYR
jgi:hypothetical protein